MKNIVIKYLSLENIENTITCLYYKIDGVIFFGRKNIIEEESHNTTSFLNKYCSTSVIDYICIDNKTIDEIKDIISSFNNDCRYFIDITGSDGLFTASALVCSRNYPLHIYDIKENKVANITTKYDHEYSINDLEKRSIKLSVSSYINMVGGRIVTTSNSNFKYDINEQVIELRNNHKSTWNYFSNIINKSNNLFDSLTVTCSNLKILVNQHIDTIEVETILKEAKDLGLIKNLNLDISNSKLTSFKFDFVNSNIKHLIKNTGAVFEQIVYLDNKKNSTDCMISVNLDWDGKIREFGQADVRNEIDVIRLDGHIITFISCKNREIRKEDIYELESIARNFAGNYVQMEIATPCTAKEEVELRANELGVKIAYYQ